MGGEKVSLALLENDKCTGEAASEKVFKARQSRSRIKAVWVQFGIGQYDVFAFKVDLPLNQKGVMQAVKGAMLLVCPCGPLPTQASFNVERHFTILRD